MLKKHADVFSVTFSNQCDFQLILLLELRHRHQACFGRNNHVCFITLEQHFCIYASIFSASDDNLNCQFTFCISSLCAACSLFIFPPYREAVRLCVCLVIIRGVNWTSRNLSRAFSLLKVPSSTFTLKNLFGLFSSIIWKKFDFEYISYCTDTLCKESS